MAKTRDEEQVELKSAYEKGASIRVLAAQSGRSYGYIHRALVESGVTLRGRGGPNRRGRKAP
ncbi:transcriptional regulator [Mycobacterium sp. CBMA271]|nr:transcriptional regulator [Mycobacteroides sp. CBMA 271]